MKEELSQLGYGDLDAACTEADFYSTVGDENQLLQMGECFG